MPGLSTWGLILARYQRPSFAWALTEMLMSCRGNARHANPAAAWSIYFGSRILRMRKWDSNEQLPTGFAIETDSCVVIGVNGTDSWEQAWEYTRPSNSYGYLGRDDNQTPGTGVFTNLQFHRWGVKVANLVGEALSYRYKPVLITGHSYGGAVAACAAREFFLRGYPKVICITFGQPKVGNRVYNEPFFKFPFIRYMTFGDPVPAAPPTEGEIKFPLKIHHEKSIEYVLPNVVQGPGGIRLYPDGRMTAENLSKLTFGVIEVILDLDVVNRSAIAPSYHLLQIYSNWLVKISAREPIYVDPRELEGLNAQESGLDIRPIGNGGSPYQIVDSKEVEALKLAVIRSAPSFTPFGAGRFKMNGYVGCPKEFKPYVRRTSGTQYGVYWCDKLIFAGMTQGSARVNANKLWAFIKRLSITDTFSSSLFIEAMGAFVTAAQAGGDGWNPSPWYIPT